MFRNFSSPLARLTRTLMTLRGGIALMLVVTVPGGHTVYWDAFAETAEAVEAFLSEW